MKIPLFEVETLTELYQFLSRAHFERPSDEVKASEFGAKIKSAIESISINAEAGDEQVAGAKLDSQVSSAPSDSRSRFGITVVIPAVVREALEIAHDLVVAEADHVHTTYAGYKQHKHDAVDRDVQTVKDALARVETLPDAELAEDLYSRQEISDAFAVCQVSSTDFDAIDRALSTHRAAHGDEPLHRIKFLALCESNRIIPRPNQPYIYRVHKNCPLCNELM